jgi:RimJ/RimL family protein N-acetyltransferase
MTSTLSDADAKRPRVSLRPLRASDKFAVRRWMADFDVIGFTVVVPGPDYGPIEPYDHASADRYLDLLIREPDRRSFAIIVDGAHVGNVGLKHIDLGRGTAECFIEIGEVAMRRRGVGAQAMGLMLDVAFSALRLDRVRLGVFEFNDGAIALYRKLGFVDDGALGEHWVDGRTYVVRAMCLDAAAWRARLSTC